MRLTARSVAACVLLVALSLGSVSEVEAGNACASYQLSSPVGANGNSFCSPVSDPFSQPLTSPHCAGVPPLGVQACANVILYTP